MMFFDDFRYALRLLAKNPSFTVLTTFVMAAGVGISLLIFSFIHSMVYKPLPFKNADTLVVIDSVQNGNYYNGGNVALHDLYEISQQIKGFKEWGQYAETTVNVAGRDGARRYVATAISPNIFEMTRTKPIIGRQFNLAETVTGQSDVVVVGYDMWQNQMGGRQDVLDQTLLVNGVQKNIIGVMPRGYFFPRNTEMWIPDTGNAEEMERGKSRLYYTGLAHLAPNVSFENINNQLDVIMRRIENRFPKTNSGLSAYVTTLPLSIMGNGVEIFFSVLYVVAVLLLILASINVGNLLLSRAVERSKETAIRVALGAPRSRLIGQMLWESTIICSVGGLIGLLIAAWGLEISETITATFTTDKPFYWWKFGIDAYAIKLFFLMLIGSILLTGLLPAWKNSGGDFNAVLRDGTRGSLSKKSGRLNRILVMSEVFISLTVLISATVMVLGTYFATHADYGAEPENILTAKIYLPDTSYDTALKRIVLIQKLQQMLENNEAIGDVMIANALPGQGTWVPSIAINGREVSKIADNPRANYVVLTVGSLKKLGVELIEGRYFNNSDNGLDKRTVLISESFALQNFKGESPIGKRLRVIESDGDTLNWLTIVGVVEHTIHGEATGKRAKNSSIFRPITQSPRSGFSVAMKMKAGPNAATRSLRNVLEKLDINLPAYRIKTYDALLARNSAGIGFASKMFLVLAIVSIVLASSGIYGVMSNTIVQRTQEIGVKRALGANEAQITRDFLWVGFKQLLWGGIPGLLAGCGLGFAVSQIFGIGYGYLVLTAIAMVVIIGIVVMLATYLPTRRALKMEPSVALQHE